MSIWSRRTDQESQSLPSRQPVKPVCGFESASAQQLAIPLTYERLTKKVGTTKPRKTRPAPNEVNPYCSSR